MTDPPRPLDDEAVARASAQVLWEGVGVAAAGHGERARPASCEMMMAMLVPLSPSAPSRG